MLKSNIIPLPKKRKNPSTKRKKRSTIAHVVQPKYLPPQPEKPKTEIPEDVKEIDLEELFGDLSFFNSPYTVSGYGASKISVVSPIMVKQIITEYAQTDNSIREIGKQFGISENLIMATIYNRETYRNAFEKAEKYRASALVRATQDIADQVLTDNPAEVKKAELRIRTRQWMASKYNREKYGEKPDTTINIGIQASDVRVAAWSRRMEMDKEAVDPSLEV